MERLAIDWESVYEEQLPRVFNFLRYRVYDDMLAEDLTQTAFLKAWRKRDDYRSDQAAFSTWVFTIARNLATDHLRRTDRIIPLDFATNYASEHSVEDHAQQQDDLRELHRLLKTLSDTEREIISLKFGANLTNREIAPIVSKSESNVGTILDRALKKLRGRWGGTAS